MKKRALSILLVLILLASCIPFGALSVSAAVGDNSYTERESNDLKTSANLIYDDYTVSGSISTNYDFDYYKFSLSTATTIGLTFISPDSFLLITILNSNSQTVKMYEPTTKTSGDYYGFAEALTLSAGTYYMQVMTRGYGVYPKEYMFYYEVGVAQTHTHTYTNSCDTTCNTCGYTRTITHTFSNETDSICDVCGAVVENGLSINSAYTLKNNVVYTKEWTKSNYSKDCFNKIVLSKTGYITFTIDKPMDSTGTISAVWLRMYNSDGTEVWNAETSSHKNTISSQVVYKIGLPAGTYYLNIDPRFMVTSGTISCKYKYTFTESAYWEKEPNSDQAAALEMMLGKTYTGVFGETYLYVGDEDTYKMQLTAGTRYRFTLGNYSKLKAQSSFITELKAPSGSRVSNFNSYTGIDDGTSRYWIFTPEESGWHYFQIHNVFNKPGCEYTVMCEKEIVNIANLSVSLDTIDYVYDGTVKAPTVTVKDAVGKTVTSSNYTVTYASGCKNVGTYKVTVTMKGNYSGSKTLTFKINPVSSTECTFKLSTTSYTYNGAVKTPSVTVKDSAGKTISSSNYTVTYATGRKNAGTYTVKVTMKGNYSGTKTLSFKINPIDIAKCTVKLSATSYTYNGAVKTPSVTVKNANGTTLTKNTHYTVTYATGRKGVGTYKVTIKMKGNYSGTKVLSFKINPISISKCKVSLSATSYTYDGKVKAPTVTVKNANGTKLTKNTHYTVTYATGRKNVGTYKVTIKMKGNYSGTKVLTFKINPPKTTVSKVTPATKSLKVSITKKSTQVTGYQIQYATTKSFKSPKTKTVTSYKTTSTTISSLKAKTTYYVRVRTYKTVSGVKYYSGWSTYKYAKTK